ncbi:MAG: pseudouridine synthase [Prevotellaceae bacterium]|jgi:23S rRNA pseudouridine2605 synthase|nr:pseudouridine synthase [Prevotellaceae bacterium]
MKTAYPKNNHNRLKYNEDRPSRPGRLKRDDDRAPFRSGRPKRDEERPYRSSRPKRDEERPFRSSRPKRDEERPYRSGRPKRDEERPYRSSRSKYGEERQDRKTLHSKDVGKPARKEAKLKPEKEEVRLNKFIANSGICSRREADEYITAGLVSVNGKVVTELGVKVKPTDDVRFNGERMKGERKVYIVMNKPKDYVTTTGDPHAENMVTDLISSEKCPERVFPIGRLDRNTTGVLLFSNDGNLAEQLTHPSYNRKKVYHVFLDKNLKQSDLKKLVEGVELEDGLAQADMASYVDGDLTQVGLEIHSGRNRIVRRMFEYLGYRVKKLDRVYFAGITKKSLKRGQWRFLTEQEVTMLRMGAYE